MSEETGLKVIRVDPPQNTIVKGCGCTSRTGTWMATTNDGRKFKFVASIYRNDVATEEHLLQSAQEALDNNTHIGWL